MSNKPDDILVIDGQAAERVNKNFDDLYARMGAQAVAIAAYRVSLVTDVTGNLPVANLNGGTNASGSTFWRGDGTWNAPPQSTVQLTGTLTNAQVLTLNSAPVQILAAPGAGIIIVPMSLYAYSLPTALNTPSATVNLRYNGLATNIMTAGLNWCGPGAGVETEFTSFNVATIGSNASAVLANKAINIFGSNDTAAGNVANIFKYVLTYYLVTRP